MEQPRHEHEITSKTDIIKKRTAERIAEVLPDQIADTLCDQVKDTGTYSEKLKLTGDNVINSLERMDGQSAFLLNTFTTKSITTEEFMQLMHQVQERYPELEFSFDRDPEGKWFEYSVSLTA